MGLRLTAERLLSRFGDPLLAALGGAQPAAVACLILHSVRDRPRHKIDVTPDQLARLLEAVRSIGARVISLPAAVERLRAGGLDGAYVVLTFDDGYDDFASHAVPVLERYRAPATLSIVTHHVESGEPFRFDSGDDRRSLSWSQLTELQERLGERLTLANHSHRHRDFARMSEAEIRRDLERSQELIGSRLGAPTPYFTYPFGSRSALSDRLVEERFETVLGGVWGPNRNPAHARCLRRVAVFEYDRATTLRRKATGRVTAYQLVRDRLRRHR